VLAESAPIPCLKRRRLLSLCSAAAAASLSGCAVLTRPSQRGAAVDGWEAVPLPGKAATRYIPSSKEGRIAISASADASASMWRKRVNVAPDALGSIRFSWWVQDLIADAGVGNREAEDSPARIVLAFDGDRSRLSARNRALFELAQALSGEVPPYATLMYVYDSSAPVGSVVVNHRTDRIRKVVLDSGVGRLRQWRDHERDLVADFQLAYGEAPGALLAIGLMTDADNSRGRAKAWYGPVSLLPAASSAR
jgi:hypothetical protein